jgi:archaellum biogenesis ATPase FlaH
MQTIKLDDLLTRGINSRACILGKWLTAQSLNMIYAPRGLGKTNFCLWLAASVAAGQKFLNWDVETSKKVLYIDSEMCLSELKNRLVQISETIHTNFAHNITLITPDLQPLGVMPDLSTVDGQVAISKCISQDVDLIIIDNLSSLLRAKPNSWLIVQNWLLQLKNQGKCVIIVHHANKEGKQRGSSRHEDAMDCVLALRKPADYKNSDGCRFNLVFEKCRSYLPLDSISLACQMVSRGTYQEWEWSTIAEDEGNNSVEISLFRERLGAVLDKKYTKRINKLNLSSAKSTEFIKIAVEMGAAFYVRYRMGYNTNYISASQRFKNFDKTLSVRAQFWLNWLSYKIFRIIKSIYGSASANSAKNLNEINAILLLSHSF